MNVGELIAKLKCMPKDAIVMVGPEDRLHSELVACSWSKPTTVDRVYLSSRPWGTNPAT